MSELAFKRWFVSMWKGGPITRIEPRVGGDAGVADLMVVIDGELLPVELKLLIGEKMSTVRPGQRAWHNRHRAAGVVTIFLAGEMKGSKCCRMMAFFDERGRETGEELNVGDVTAEITNLARRLRESVYGGVGGTR